MIGNLELWGFTLLDPWFLAVAPLLLLAWWWRLRSPRAALPTASSSLFDGLPRTWRQRIIGLPLLLKVLAGLCLTVALARPVKREVVPLREQGIDIVLVIDTSSSMNFPDMREGEEYRRMDAARDRAQEFAAARINDRVGMVAFARYAELRCPPTLDEVALAAFLRVIDTVPEGSEFDRTAIGVGLTKAVQVLRDSDAESRVVVLLSDGENNIDDIVPDQAAKLAKDSNVRVHTIGLGIGQPTALGFIPLEFKELKAIAEKTGGQFFQPRSDADLGEVYARIDELEKTELDDPRYRTVDRFEWPLAIGLLGLLLGLLVDSLIVRRVPS